MNLHGEPIKRNEPVESLETERNASTASVEYIAVINVSQRTLDSVWTRNVSGKFKCVPHVSRISGTAQLEDFIADLNLALPIQV